MSSHIYLGSEDIIVWALTLTQSHFLLLILGKDQFTNVLSQFKQQGIN